jgi:hypothetical protein
VKLPILLLSASMLMGCQPRTDIDKCVDLLWELDSTKAEQAIKKGEILNWPHSKEVELEIKLIHRLRCMRAQAGNE